MEYAKSTAKQDVVTLATCDRFFSVKDAVGMAKLNDVIEFMQRAAAGKYEFQKIESLTSKTQ